MTKIFLMLTALFCLNTACNKKEIQGPKGDPGKNGTGGNASTEAGSAFQIGTTAWSTTDSSVWYYTFLSTQISKAVADSGFARIFILRNNAWYELPYAEGDLIMQAGFSEGTVKLTYQDIHGSLPARPVTASYRLVTVFRSARSGSVNNKGDAINNLKNDH